MLVGRTQELDFLESGYRKAGASLLALYGKRRTGKTELLKSFCRDKRHAFYVCRETTDAEQIRLFSQKILADSPMARYIERFPDWESAFSFLLERKDQKDVVIIDEFPYMIQSNPAIPSILQKVWDERSTDGNTLLILTGSSVQTMEQEILGGDRPLFGRTDGVYQVDELNWDDAMALSGARPLQALQTVALLGGVPRYLAQFDPALSLQDNIRENLLRKGCTLYSEVDCLMRQDLREPSTYYTILESLALGDGRIARIAERTGLDRTKINVYLKNLQALKVVVREEPVGTRPGGHNGRYRINGNYLRFYFRFMYPNYSLLEEGETERLYGERIAPHLDGFLQESYLDCARERLRADNKADRLTFRADRIGAFWNRQAQIPLMAASAKTVLFADVSADPAGVDLSHLDRLREQSVLSGVPAQTRLYRLYSPHGFQPALQAVAQADPSVSLCRL